jgi:hypothetical protein
MTQSYDECVSYSTLATNVNINSVMPLWGTIIFFGHRFNRPAINMKTVQIDDYFHTFPFCESIELARIYGESFFQNTLSYKRGVALFSGP